MPPQPFDLGQTLQQALALHQQGKLRDAEKLYARVLKAAPGNFDALHLLGLVKAQSGQMGEAYRLMASAVRINAQSPDAWSNLANVLQSLKRHDEALEATDRALQLRPGDPSVLQQRGNILLSLARPADAIASFDAVLRANPRQGEALFNRGTAKAALGNPAEALADFDAALKLMPQHPNALYNRGNALLDLGRPADAIVAFDQALARAPQHVKALNNRGRALQALNRHAEALAAFDKAVVVDKDYADAHFNRSHALLTLGELRKGFAEYEWRWKRSGMEGAARKLGRPLWLGEYPLGGKTILLHAEQGLGDTIQFVRYAPLLAKAGAKVVLEVQPELKALLSGLEGIQACVARGETLPAFDVHCPLLSLPLAMKTDLESVPAPIPYLHANAERIERWKPRLEALPGKRVAIAWAGHTRHVNDRNRSLALEQLAPLFARDGVSFVSIQRELRDGDAEILARYGNVTHVGDALTDMADTAAIAALADLTLAVDTSVVHLAGALGRPVWIMLPFVPDWRWGLTQETSPWYPQARLFRQPALADWAQVVAAVGGALTRFAAD
ncbi:tetratricopeptide repeat protein [Pseudolabrys taiwanensis]|uniref:Tetratricopeptide repeat protein n=1 Tax=Pseudolabrys taiwanensis TaxID=331696 RepID=A0A345ZS88_9HYPH|nr:tetratricopeptide repeat protein [Pseudolabrys taiwanensis]AXK79785.1 tetratricopeptide repeat protein [Pseudolabrys taiwanensis]